MSAQFAEVLERHRNAVQRARRKAGAGLAVARLGHRHGLIAIDRDEGVQLVVGGADARQAIGGQLGRGQLARGDGRRQAVRGHGDQIVAQLSGHGGSPLSL